ncbi:MULTISPECIES: hypothetical protein [Streptomyces]|uniref:Uncharacterized protein n=2 Tax=Streptomyces TaxID=1883 RepID=A0A1I6UW68_9ACTN|nr:MULTISPECIES: hypothetical protein [Streptomyces]QKV69289.1 hypothetical protein HUT13_11230 [Streptomyces harbinensis]SFT05691.1 hypothetical protein SAMN05444716_106252 [Streptomyces harbinensis]
MTAPTPLAWLVAEEFTGWSRTGTCSMCQTEDVPVVWAGSVVAYGRSRPVRACATCLGRLAQFVRGEAPGPYGPTRYASGDSRLPSAASARPTTTDRAFHTITLLGITAMAASLLHTWWTIR